MKNLKLILAGIFIVSLSVGALAQIVGPPDPPGSHGESNDQPAGNAAPIGDGLFILLTAGLVYGGKKVYRLLHESEAEPLA